VKLRETRAQQGWCGKRGRRAKEGEAVTRDKSGQMGRSDDPTWKVYLELKMYVNQRIFNNRLAGIMCAVTE